MPARPSPAWSSTTWPSIVRPSTFRPSALWPSASRPSTLWPFVSRPSTPRLPTSPPPASWPPRFPKPGWLRLARRPAALLAAFGIALTLGVAGLALRGHILDAARRDLHAQASLAAAAVRLHLAQRERQPGMAEPYAGALPAVDLGPGGALALLGSDGTRLAPDDEVGLPGPGLPAGPGLEGIATTEAAGPLPARLLAWRRIPEYGVTVVASRDRAVVLLPWRRGMQAVALSLLVALGIVTVTAASAAARARASDVALTLSEARAALVADALDVAIWFRSSPTSITRFFGDSVERITGYSRDLLESRPGVWTELVQHPADRAALRSSRAAADLADARGEPPSERLATFRIIRADGAVRWLHSRIRRLGDGTTVGVLHDVTELTLAQAALAHREAELADIVRIARIGMLRLPTDREVVELSSELAAIWSLPEGSALAIDRFAAMLTPETRAGTVAALAAVRRDGRSVDVEFSIRLADGSVRHAWARARRETDPESERCAVIAVVQDITERRVAQRALAQAQRMSALGHLTGGVAHDFNNLLTVVLLNLERILDAVPHDSMPGTAAAQASGAAETAARLTAQLLAFAGRQPLRPAAIEPAGLLSGLAPTLARVLGPRIALAISVAPGCPCVFADPTQLRIALLNLAGNAREATDGEGTLTIAVSGDGRGRVAFAVTDEGSGMGPEVVARAFEPFFTTKGTGHGSGLGLSQAYGFVAQSQGEIAIESSPGFGTTVRFALPACGRDHPGAPTPRFEGEPRQEPHQAPHQASRHAA